MRHIEGEDRNQTVLFPESLEEYVSEQNAVRFVDAFVENLDLGGLGFQKAIPKETGRPPYNPSDLLKLYLYGYLNRIRSSRALERESHRNVELMWLIRKLHPDFKTVADFRKDNIDGIRSVCSEFVLLCRRMELFGRELIAIDGSKFKAANSKKRNFTAGKVKRMIRETEEKIDEYLRILDEEDEKESGESEVTAEELKKKIEWLKQNRDRYCKLQEEMQKRGENQISLTDSESRAMYLGQAIQISYNVQTAVEGKNKFIIEHEVTNSVTDQGQLLPLALKAKEILQTEKLELLADMGYYYGEQIKACQEAGITSYIPKPNSSANLKQKMFTKANFIYESDKDRYRCPAKKYLTYRFDTVERNRHIRYYVASGCNRCYLKSKCTRNKVRRITRWIGEDILDEMARRIRSHPEKIGLRKTLSEHPFGTIKRWMDQGYFLMRGLQKVSAEVSLSVLAYNMKRAFSILGVSTLIQALK